MGVAFDRQDFVDKDATARGKVFVHAVQRLLCLGVSKAEPIVYIRAGQSCGRNLLHNFNVIENVRVGLSTHSGMQEFAKPHDHFGLLIVVVAVPYPFE